MLVAAIIQEIHHRQWLMHAHQGFLARYNLAFQQSQMRFIGGAIEIGNQLKFAIRGLYGFLGDALYQRFSLSAVMNQIGNGADLELMVLSEFQQIWQPRHGAVILQNFADHGSGL